MPTLSFSPVLNCPDLVAPSVLIAVRDWKGSRSPSEIEVAEIDPVFCGGESLCQEYNVDPRTGANCLIVEARRGEIKNYCACLAPVGFKMDLGGVLRRHLGARVVSMAPLDFVLESTRMEHGSVTPIGIPSDWKIVLDESLSHVQKLIVGGGLKKSKLRLPAQVLLSLPNASILKGLGKDIS